MIDTNWLLWCRVFFDYTNAASTQLLTRTHSDAVTDMVDESTETSTIRRVGYTITGLVLALTVGPLFLFGVYTIITSLVGH
jgi:hypothetical protein